MPLLVLVFLSACGGGGGGSSYVAPSLISTSYSGKIQTKTYSNGATTTTTASGQIDTYASDHVTKTTTYLYSDGGSNPVVTTVSPTVALPTYSGGAQTIVTTYGDGHTSTATNAATSTAVSWGLDHITKTTTYTFANGGTNPVVTTVSPILSAPVYTSATYSNDWTLSGGVAPPAVSPKQNTYGDGYVLVLEDGSHERPFAQNTLSSLFISDPSKYVASATTTYDLNWGAPDKNGPGYANVYPGASNTLMAPKSYAGIAVSGQTTSGPTVLQPSPDVLSAWNNGWTGKGSNILLIDSYADRATCTSENSKCHGVMTMMNADYIAPGAAKYGLDFAFNTNFTGAAFDSAGVNLTSSKLINVINMSWLFSGSWNCNNGCGVAPTDATYNDTKAAHSPTHGNLINVLNGVSNITNLSNFSNAVITASAGNDNLDTKYNLTALALAQDPVVASRLLIVGALDKNGTASSPASRSLYSNYAGSNAAISDRFVMAYGKMPWSDGSVAINGGNFGVVQGTSMSAPLVAGYAAIVMQKFPNLSAANTSNIILDTARTDTLSCTPSCDPAIYGKGEASLSRALAPVGRLR